VAKALGESGGLSIPGYEILAELGRGGMGVVYKARQIEPDRIVALKLILSGRASELMELARFRIEAEAIECLNHPNVIDIFQVGVHDGIPYLTLEYTAGGSLAAKVRGQTQPPRWSAELVRTLALTLQYAHDRGILHRDLKPANVLLAADGKPKLSDFGLAKFMVPMDQASVRVATITTSSADHLHEEAERAAIIAFLTRQRDNSPVPETQREQAIAESYSEHYSRARLGQTSPTELGRIVSAVRVFLSEVNEQSRGAAGRQHPLDDLTRDGAVMGSPQYMAPEQANGAKLDIGPRTDVYGLGAILYALLTGRPPFHGGTVVETLEQVRSLRPPAIGNEVSRDLVAICRKCLCKRVTRRYRSAAALADDLQRFLDGYRPIVRRPAMGPRKAVTEGPPTALPPAATNPPEDPAATRSWWQFWK
jgi:serine/threonine protein kinase